MATRCRSPVPRWRRHSSWNIRNASSSKVVAVGDKGKVMLEGQISQAVSRNPVFSFRLKGVKAGDMLEIAWLDNRGERPAAPEAE